jgi:triosephosphate isomerase
MRKTIIAGNWKMNLSHAAALQLAEEVASGMPANPAPDVQVLLFTPSVFLLPVADKIKGMTGLAAGAQNAAAWKEGAYTGEVSAMQLASAGIEYTLLGHSERRTLFGESDDVLKTKVDLALEAGLFPIFCCGEPREVREAGSHEALVGSQIRNALFHLTSEQFGRVIIAYEPVWAIGTGLTASSQQAQDMHAFIRREIASVYGNDIADSVSILYGGSMKASNAAELLSMSDVDGGLIGGASLVATEFLQIISCAYR